MDIPIDCWHLSLPFKKNTETPIWISFLRIKIKNSSNWFDSIRLVWCCCRCHCRCRYRITSSCYIFLKLFISFFIGSLNRQLVCIYFLQARVLRDILIHKNGKRPVSNSSKYINKLPIVAKFKLNVLNFKTGSRNCARDAQTRARARTHTSGIKTKLNESVGVQLCCAFFFFVGWFFPK